MSNHSTASTAELSTLAGGAITLWIPAVPDSVLSPNSTAHWREKATSKRALREVSYLSCTSQLNALPYGLLAALPQDREVIVGVEILWPSRRKVMDQDNAIASLKALLDGVADALQRDDSTFRLSGLQQRKVHPDGTPGVLLTIAPGDLRAS